MTENNNSRMVTLFIAGLFVIAITMVAVIYVATRRPVVVIVPGVEVATGPQVATAGAVPGDGAAAAAAPLPTISLMKLESIPSIENPLDPAWDTIATAEIPLEMQQTSEPMLTENTFPKVQLQTAYNSDRFVWRLSWEQAEPSFKSNVADLFRPPEQIRHSLDSLKKSNLKMLIDATGLKGKAELVDQLHTAVKLARQANKDEWAGCY